MELLYQAPNLEISYDRATRIMYCNWIGFQEKEIIMKCGGIMLALLKEKKITKILNDNSLVTGPWHTAADWTAKEWFPEMIRAGLKHFAWIISPNIFAEVSARKAMLGASVVKTFKSYEEAYAWLVAQE